jgi:hypothetical protein
LKDGWDIDEIGLVTISLATFFLTSDNPRMKVVLFFNDMTIILETCQFQSPWRASPDPSEN